MMKVSCNTSKKLSSDIKLIIFKEDSIQKIPVTMVRDLTMPFRKKGTQKTLTETIGEKKQFKGYYLKEGEALVVLIHCEILRISCGSFDTV